MFSYSLVTIYFRFVPYFQLCVGTLHTGRITSGTEHWDLNFNRLSVKPKRMQRRSHLGVSGRLCSNPRSCPVRVVTSMVRNCCQHPEASLKWWCGCSEVGAGVHVITDSICGSLTPMWPTEGTFQSLFFCMWWHGFFPQWREIQYIAHAISTKYESTNTLSHSQLRNLWPVPNSLSCSSHSMILSPHYEPSWLSGQELTKEQWLSTWQPPAWQLLLDSKSREREMIKD